MKLLVMSDLHFEFMRDHGDTFLDIEWPDHDVCVLAGDLSSSKHFASSMEKCCRKFDRIVYVSGNHEYYSSRYSVAKKLILRQASIFKNLHILNNSECVLDGQRFVGGTMWYPRELDPMSRFGMNDFVAIKGIESVYEENSGFRNYIFSVDPDDIVVTHHCPSRKSIPDQHENDPINAFFVDYAMENVIMQRQPKLWIHGHTHSHFDYKMGSTRVYCNPLGYPDEYDWPLFFASLIIEV